MTLELMLCHPTLPYHTSLSSYRSGRHVTVFKDGNATEALREIEEKFAQNNRKLALHSLRHGRSLCPDCRRAGIELGSPDDRKMEVSCI